jgi:hypothetical protein
VRAPRGIDQDISVIGHVALASAKRSG